MGQTASRPPPAPRFLQRRPCLTGPGASGTAAPERKAGLYEAPRLPNEVLKLH